VTVAEIPVADIVESARNPRQRPKNIEDLAASLQAYGLLQPVIVRPVGEGYELLAGSRRLQAARQLGWSTISAIIRSEGQDDGYLLTLVENLQREDLSPREQASGLEVLVREQGWSTRQVAAAIQRSQAFVSKRLRVFEDPMLAPAVLANQLSVSAAEELLTAPERHRYDILARAIQGGWDRGQVRRVIKTALDTGSGPQRRPGLSRDARDLRVRLRDLRPEDLTDADRRELRLLFAELAMLARARPGATRVFPPLPRLGRYGR
jgi:ParB family chromosome partitioning protein